MRVHAVDLDYVFSKSKKVAAIEAKINASKAVGGPSTALKGLKLEYSELIREATQLTKKIKSDETRSADKQRLKNELAMLTKQE